jgi:hypothetical protein
MNLTRTRARAGSIALTAALLTTLGACGAGGDTGTAIVPTSMAEDGAPMNGTTDETMSAAMNETMNDMDHEHGDDREWEGTPPVVEVAVSGDAGSGWDVVATIDGDFTFTDLETTTPVNGQGHVHFVLDGRILAMAYEPTMHIDELAPGEHTIEVTLASNDHADYVIEGEVIGGAAHVTVEGEAQPADITIEAEVAGGALTEELGRMAVSLGSIVELKVTSDVADELHVHGYEVMADAASGEETILRFTADIPGVFEIELESSQILIVTLEVS